MTTLNNPTQNIYGLNSLRFFAFLSVFVCHATPYLEKGNLGIDFFFVLSSFLLTYLALNEIKSTGKFSRKNFFIRRSLRIYPLYYLIILFSFIVLPAIANIYKEEISLPKHQLLYYFFLSNFDTSDHLYPLKFLWSIAVEEQFYILFLGLSLFFKKNILIPIVSLIILFVAGTIIGMRYNWLLYTNPVFYLAHFAAGMLAAYLYFNNKSLTLALQVTILFLLLTTTIVFFNINLIRPFRNLSLSLLFAVTIILTINLFRKGIIKKNIFITATEELGKYTYGLYVYSGFMIMSGNRLFSFNNWVLKFFAELILLFLVAWISYHLYEKKFLRLKSFFKR